MEFPVKDLNSTVEARVEDVLPKLGLAFASDGSSRSWGITRSTPGILFDELRPGQRLRLRIEAFKSFSLVRGCEPVS